ncbi:MAG: hypothetical protein K1X88_31550 [Nannocystaceae bacterium]|nr:hypothetical protein [Nannocystaceae bacterium]
MRRSPLLALFALSACFDPTKADGAEGSGSSDGTATSTAGTMSEATSASASTTATADSGTSAADVSGTDASSGDATTGDATTGGGVPPICDHSPTALAACAAAMDGTPDYGTLSCDATVTDFSIFYEDVYTVELVAGQCLYARADNIGEAGVMGGVWADVALQVRSPSGATSWHDDELACSETTWTGGACPQALLTADVDGTYELSIVQASGGGCTASAPYSLYVAIDGVATVPALTQDDQLADCTP